MKIGLFDSGLGGLLILKAVAKQLPEYDYEYYGDTKNLPYGDRTEEEIYQLTKVGIIHLFERQCVLVVVACNTASAETLRRLQDEFLPEAYPDRKILGVIIPVVEEVVGSKCKKVLMFATTRTVSSGKYHLELGKRNEINTKIEAVATPELVPLIEAGNITGANAIAQALIDERLQNGGEVNGLILGCTHYTMLTDTLRQRYGNTIKIFSQTEIIPHKLALYLQNHPEIETTLSRAGDRNVYLTEHREDYDRYISVLLEGPFLSQ
jgi:glutamate racemase